MSEREIEILLVGGGVAAASAAATLREEGFDGTVTLVGRELDPPYHRPPATKGYLQGRERREDAYVHPPRWWEHHDVELLTRTSVLALDPAERTARLSNKETIRYRHALIATGAMVRRLTVEGAQLDGIHYVRALANADAIRRDLETASEIVLVGGSYVACECAASLAALGKRCTIVMQEDEPLERSFGPAVGRWVRTRLERRGVAVRGGGTVARLEGEERVRAVVTDAGETHPADLVIAGVGATPDVMLARRAGLPIGELGGVRCDDRLRVVGHPGLFAAGDVCEFDSPLHGRPMRIEHEDVARAQGATAARNMLGADEPHTAVPYFFSDLGDWAALEYVGPAQAWDEEVVEGDLDGERFAVWYLHGGTVRALLSVNDGGDLERARRLIAQRASRDAIGLAGAERAS